MTPIKVEKKVHLMFASVGIIGNLLAINQELSSNVRLSNCNHDPTVHALATCPEHHLIGPSLRSPQRLLVLCTRGRNAPVLHGEQSLTLLLCDVVRREPQEEELALICQGVGGQFCTQSVAP